VTTCGRPACFAAAVGRTVARGRFVASLWILFALAPALSGCVATLRRPLPENEAADFRTAAVRFLKEAAFSPEPTLRMQAIEAFQSVAPDEGLEAIGVNILNEFGGVEARNYPGVTFAGLMALGSMRNADYIALIRQHAEDPDPNIVIAALFALHRLGDERRTGELSEYLLRHRDARVRANAALAIGRLGEPKSVKLLRMALHREKKSAAKLQILEALAVYGDRNAVERLIFDGYSARPDQAALALMCLANAGCVEAEDLFFFRLKSAEYPEIRLQAARGLGRLGFDDGLDAALAHLYFNSPDRGRQDDPPDQQIARIRALAALALETIGDPAALGPLKDAFEMPGQSDYVHLAVARAAIRIIDGRGLNRPRPSTQPTSVASGGRSPYDGSDSQ